MFIDLGMAFFPLLVLLADHTDPAFCKATFTVQTYTLHAFSNFIFALNSSYPNLVRNLDHTNLCTLISALVFHALFQKTLCRLD